MKLLKAYDSFLIFFLRRHNIVLVISLIFCLFFFYINRMGVNLLHRLKELHLLHICHTFVTHLSHIFDSEKSHGQT